MDKALSRSYGLLRSARRAAPPRLGERIEILKGKKPAGAYVYVATTYPDWRKAVLKTARAVCNGSLVEKKELLGALKKDPAFAKDGPFAKQAKLAMQFDGGRLAVQPRKPFHYATRGGRPRRVRRRPALLPGPDPGRVEDLCPEEHLRRRL